jgi:hypothetical protein
VVDRFLGSGSATRPLKLWRFLVLRQGFVNRNLPAQSKQILLEPPAHQGYLEPRFRLRADDDPAM